MVFEGVPLTLGVEEEYQIIHPKTRDLHAYVQKFLEQEAMFAVVDRLLEETLEGTER